jgi:hypothetical protein
MAIKVEHEIHHRRFGRNLGVGLLLGGFAVVTFALTLVKVSNGDRVHAGDHAVSAVSVTEGTAKP